MAKENKSGPKQKRPTALKRDMQAKKRNLRNRSFKARVRTAIRGLDLSLEQKQADKAQECLQLVHSLMDKGAQKGIFKDHKASRIKSRTTARVARALTQA